MHPPPPLITSNPRPRTTPPPPSIHPRPPHFHLTPCLSPAILIISTFFAGISSLTVTSRIAFAMARDGAFPASSYIRVIYPATKSPLATVALVFIVDALLLLLPLGTTVALTAVLSITVIGALALARPPSPALRAPQCYARAAQVARKHAHVPPAGLTAAGYQVSYAIPLVLRVIYRDTFVPGAFSLGAFSLPIHIIASSWLLFTSLIFFVRRRRACGGRASMNAGRRHPPQTPPRPLPRWPTPSLARTLARRSGR